MKKLLRFLKGYRLPAIIAPLSKYVEAVIELIIPFFVQAMIDDGINADGQTNSVLFTIFGIDAGTGTSIQSIVWLGVIMVGLSVVGLGFSLICQYLASKSAVGFGCNVRSALYRHIQSIEVSKLDDIGVGALVNRLSSDVSAAQQGLAMFLRLLLRSPFLTVGAVIMCVLIAPQFWFVYVGAAVICFVVMFLVMFLSVPRFTKVQENLDDISMLTNETMKGQRVIRSFANEKQSAGRFDDKAKKHTASAVSASIISCLINPLVSVAVNIALVAILYFGGLGAASGDVTTGTLIALINYMTQMMLAMLAVATLMVIFSKAFTGAKRINEIFELDAVTYGQGAVTRGDEVIGMTDAEFSFGGEKPAISGVSFSLSKGQMLGITGTTGSGKSTLAHLASRLLLPTKGQVRIMGNPSADYTQDEVFKLVTLAPQKALLFSGTVRSNLAWGGELGDAQMNDALVAADADRFIAKKGGLNAVVNQKGTNFSGGEKQRLSIARALLKNAPLLILDDAASALDYVTEAKVMKSIRKKSADKALIVSTGRIGMIKNADCILVLDGGKVVGMGTHAKLLGSCELYRNMCENS